MQIHEGLADFPSIAYAVVTSGTFDGVHVGHQKILFRLRELAKRNKGETVLLTYWPHPRLVLYPKEHHLRLLSTFEEKVALLRDFGIDHLIVLPFTPEFSQMSSVDFIQTILVDKIQTKCLVIGYDHKFGKNREGSFDYLQAHSKELGFAIEEISRQDIDAMGVSSSKIRTALESGDLPTATSYLGRPYSLTGEVVIGQQIGRSIGFPTANIQVRDDYKLLPKNGVYAVTVHLEDQQYKGMLNLGNRPTVSGEQKTIEVHLFGFSGDLYHKQLTVNFIQFLREEIKFADLTALKTQLILDQDKALHVLKTQDQ
jgi:riboflavin kinase / FMN adenylyltransferase